MYDRKVPWREPIAISGLTTTNRPFPGCELDVPRLATPRANLRSLSRVQLTGDLRTINHSCMAAADTAPRDAIGRCAPACFGKCCSRRDGLAARRPEPVYRPLTRGPTLTDGRPQRVGVGLVSRALLGSRRRLNGRACGEDRGTDPSSYPPPTPPLDRGRRPLRRPPGAGPLAPPLERARPRGVAASSHAGGSR